VGVHRNVQLLEAAGLLGVETPGNRPAGNY